MTDTETTSTTNVWYKSKQFITETECVKIGGHCYETQNCVLTSNPLQYIRVCKHCGKTQIGRAQDDMVWSDQ